MVPIYYYALAKEKSDSKILIDLFFQHNINITHCYVIFNVIYYIYMIVILH